MTITEMMKEHYDEIIKAMKHVYEDSFHVPHCVYCVDMDIEDGIIVIHVFPDDNSWMEGYYRVWTCDNRNWDIFSGDDRSYKWIYKESIEPLLNEEEKRKVDLFITKYQANNPDEDDEYWMYSEVIDYIENEFPDRWEEFENDVIQNELDCTEEDYFTDILDERIRDNEQYEEMWGDEE